MGSFKRRSQLLPTLSTYSVMIVHFSPLRKSVCEISKYMIFSLCLYI